MSGIISWYEGRTAVVTGCASGIGAALAGLLLDAGAKVIALDYREPALKGVDHRPLDLRNGEAIHKTAVTIEGPIDALFNCAGITAEMGFQPADVMRVNFLGLRSLTEALSPKIAQGGSITSIASFAGRGWRTHIEKINELLETKDFADGEAWVERNSALVEHGYIFSKEVVTVWTLREAAVAIKRGVRMNATSPGPVRTALMDAVDPHLPPGVMDMISGPMGRYTVPAEQAEPLLFLGSGAALAVNGAVLPADGGQEGVLSSALR